MSRTLRVATYHPDGADSSLRSALLSIEGLRIVGEWDADAGDLVSATKQTRPNVVTVLLNGRSAERLLEQIGTLSREDPSITVVGVGLPNEPGLLKAAMRARLSELLDLPVDAEKLLSALQIAVEKHGGRSSGRLIAVRGTGGGCGGTTVAANLAAELAKLNCGKTAVVDLDFQFGQVAMMYDVSPAFTLAELSQQSEEYDERVLNNAMAKHSSGVSILARPRDMEGVDLRPAKLGAIVTALLENYAWVIVDEGSRSEATSRVVQDQADQLLLVTQLMVPSVRNATQIIASLGPDFNMEKVRLVVNRVSKKPGVVTIDKLGEALRRPVFAEIPTDWFTVSQSINLGVPLAMHAPTSKARLAIRDVAVRLATEVQSANDEARRPGVMGWLKGRLKWS